MELQDKQQELKRIKLEHPNYQYYQVSRALIDVQRSKAWSNSYKQKFPHHSYDRLIEIIDDDYCFVNKTVAKYFSYNPITQIESTIDLMTAINTLPKRHKKVMRLYLQDYDKIDIAKKMKLTQGRITQIYNEAIQRMRKVLCH